MTWSWEKGWPQSNRRKGVGGGYGQNTLYMCMQFAENKKEIFFLEKWLLGTRAPVDPMTLILIKVTFFRFQSFQTTWSGVYAFSGNLLMTYTLYFLYTFLPSVIFGGMTFQILYLKACFLFLGCKASFVGFWYKSYIKIMISRYFL